MAPATTKCHVGSLWSMLRSEVLLTSMGYAGAMLTSSAMRGSSVLLQLGSVLMIMAHITTKGHVVCAELIWCHQAILMWVAYTVICDVWVHAALESRLRVHDLTTARV